MRATLLCMAYLLRLQQCSKDAIGIVVIVAALVLPASVGVAGQDMEWANSDDVAKFAQQMKEDDPVRRKANLDNITFQSLGSNDSNSILPLLAQSLQDRDLGVRGRAARAISRLHAAVFPSLLEYQKDQNPSVRMGVVAAITELEVPVSAKVPVLMKALQDKHSGVRMQATWGVGRLGPDAREALPLLEKMVKNDEAELRVRAVQSLSHIGWKLKEAVPPIGVALSDSEEKVRMAAAHALVAIGPNAVVVLPTISSRLQDQNPSFQRLLIEAIDTIGPDAKPAVSALLDMLKSSRLDIRMATIKALGRIDGTPVLSLTRAAKGKDPTVRLRALEALLPMNELGKHGLPSTKSVQSELIGAFPPDTSPMLVDFLSEEHLQAAGPLKNEHDVCRHIAQLRKKKQLDFEYPNEDGPEGFYTWLPWRWHMDRGFDSEAFGTEVDLDNDGVQELLIKKWSWGPHMYYRAELISLASGTDLAPYFMRVEDSDELTIASNSGSEGEQQMRFERFSTSPAISGVLDRVSDAARINPFRFKGVNYLLVDQGDLVVSRYRSEGQLEVICYLPQSADGRKK